MAMVGLFWISEDSVYVGSPPTGDGRCVRLTADGLDAVGPEGSRAWTWTDLRSAAVEAAPVRGTLGSRLGMTLEVLLTAASGLGNEPAEMILRLETVGGDAEGVPLYSATAGYDPEEIALSQSLLARFVAGTADPRTVVAWGRQNSSHGTPKPHLREALLREWAQT
ncbi:hypothetical protein OG883_24910 [Streptomyces sp. NBC_01142]|uniref:hypothetical protein n=1 Tax=Streptomyces sp. NBC_01142 TaxID=2975865 RepID=UPI00225B62B1|nr:hypothetical protein [Streptomyces sp. NBC_01142]MCX4823070.1 hypothetical protein [Streptomyces sp. NBC_01142]